MKKFTKISLIIVAVMAGVGIILCGIAALMGAGRSDIWKSKALYGNWYITNEGIHYKKDDWEDTVDDIEDAVSDIEDFEIEWTDSSEETETYKSVALSDVKNIKLDIDAAYLKIDTASDTQSITARLVEGKEKNYRCKLDGDTLYVKYDEEYHIKNIGPKIELEIPKGASFDKLTIETGALDGDISLETITCKELSVDIGAGNLNINNAVVTDELELVIGAGNMEVEDGEYKNVNVECGVGNLDLSGKVSGDITGHCGMGEMDFDLEGKEKDYDYSLSCGLGEIKINGKKYSNITGEQEIDNEDEIGEIVLECGMGSVKVDFE